MRSLAQVRLRTDEALDLRKVISPFLFKRWKVLVSAHSTRSSAFLDVGGSLSSFIQRSWWRLKSPDRMIGAFGSVVVRRAFIAELDVSL